MSNPFSPKMARPSEYLPHVIGTEQIASEGVKALEALPALIERLGDDAMVAEIQIWENAPITAVVSLDYAHVTYGWNFDRWVKVGY